MVRNPSIQVEILYPKNFMFVLEQSYLKFKIFESLISVSQNGFEGSYREKYRIFYWP